MNPLRIAVSDLTRNIDPDLNTLLDNEKALKVGFRTEEGLMPFFLYQATYKDQQIKALVDNPQNREDTARQLIESFGGKLHQLFFAFGEYDIVAISEFPDTESATAAAFSLTASGAFARAHTTVLMTTAEAVRSLKRANTTKSAYRAPAG